MIEILLWVLFGLLLFGMGVFAGGYLATNGVYCHMDDLADAIDAQHDDDSNYSKGIRYCFYCMAGKIGYKQS